MPETAAVCQPIANLRFDQHSLRPLERIKQLQKTGKWINGLLGANIVFGIMFGKSAGMSSAIVPPYQITQTDWEGYARAMRAVPLIAKVEIEKEGERMYLRYATDNSNRELEKFWKGVAYGCRY